MMTRAARFVLLALPALVLLPCAESRAADVFLETTRSEFQKIPIWIMGFGNADGRSAQDGAIEDALAGVLGTDLQRTQLFEVIDRPTASLNPEGGHCTAPEVIAEAGKSAASVATWGQLGQANGAVVLEICAYDSGENKIALGKRYHGTLPTTMRFLRRMVHRWADDLVSYYTGESGMAQTRIVYVAGEASGERALYVMDYDGFGPQLVTPKHALALMPTWLPDGRSLVYTTYRRHSQKIVQLDLDSRVIRTLVPSNNLNMTPALSSDGHLLAYAAAAGGNSDLVKMNVRTRETTPLTHHGSADFSPTWSPDGDALAFVSDRGGSPQIYIMRTDGSRVRRLTFEGSYNAAPAWSPQGDWIAYVCRDAKAGFRLCRISPDGTRHTKITDGPRWVIEDSPSWAPDGRHLVFSAKEGAESHLYLVNADGTGREQVTTDARYHGEPSWSP